MEMMIKNRHYETRLFGRRLWLMIILMSIGILILLSRLFYLQIIEHRHYLTLSQKNQIDLLPITPRRGLIYDRNGVLLAQNEPVFSLVVNPNKITDWPNTLNALNKIVSLSDTDTQAFSKELKLQRHLPQIPLKLKLTPEEVARFSVNQYRFPEISVQASLLRYYPFQDEFAGVLGYVARINAQELQQVDSANYSNTMFIGKTGIEKYYEPLLHGSIGYNRLETDAAGQSLKTLQKAPATAGDDIYLTIDSQLQTTAEKAIGDNRGTIIALDPNNGEVLALLNHPTYDPNLFVAGISNKDYAKLRDDKSHPLFNRALRGFYSPGSTIKPFIAIAGLESGTTTPTQKIFDPGWYQFPNSSHIFHDWKEGGHGWVNVSKAIIESCDTYFFDLSHRMGIDTMDAMLHTFGFDSLTNIDLPDEKQGYVPGPLWKAKTFGTSWYPADTILSAIGQSYMQTTPIQLAFAVATLANQGVRYQPHLLYALKAPDQQMIYTQPKELPPIVLKDPQNWKIVIDAMSDVTTEGTAMMLFGNTPYTVGAKTGTIQVVNTQGNPYDETRYMPKNQRNNSAFIAFAPVDHPQIVLVIMIENAGYSAAVPMAKKILDNYFKEHKDKLNPPVTS